jgi:hypothetical protein
MKKITLVAITVSSLVVLTTQAADGDKNDPTKSRRERAERRETKADIDKLVRDINKLDNSPAAMRAGMAAVSKETAVPLPTIEAEHKDHPKVGLAGLFVAHELATHTSQPVDKFIKQHESGKTWTELATAQNQDLGSIEAKLSRIEAALKNSGGAASTGSDRTRAREQQTK